MPPREWWVLQEMKLLLVIIIMIFSNYKHGFDSTVNT